MYEPGVERMGFVGGTGGGPVGVVELILSFLYLFFFALFP
jgi:hypothetical protein